MTLLHRRLETELKQKNSELENTLEMLRQKEEEAVMMQQQLEASKEALGGVEERLEQQDKELQVAQSSVRDMEEQMTSARLEVHSFQATVQQQEAELARLREALGETEKELQERVAGLEQQCRLSGEERGLKILCLLLEFRKSENKTAELLTFGSDKVQEESVRRIQELMLELQLLRGATVDQDKEQVQLQQELTKEKVRAEVPKVGGAELGRTC